MIVLVTGLPAAGKTTLATRLASRLALPLLSLDSIKESLVDGLGESCPEDRLLVREAARTVLLRLASEQDRGCVVDVWLNPTRDDGDFLAAVAGLGAPVREVVCRVPVETAVQRYADRVRHGAHLPPDEAALGQIRAAAPYIGPVGLGPHVEVDTSRPVDDARMEEVLSWLRA